MTDYQKEQAEVPWSEKPLLDRLDEMAAFTFKQFGDQGYVEEFMEAKQEILALRTALAASEARVEEAREALEVIADGDEDARVIARQTLTGEPT